MHTIKISANHCLGEGYVYGLKLIFAFVRIFPGKEAFLICQKPPITAIGKNMRTRISAKVFMAKRKLMQQLFTLSVRLFRLNFLGWATFRRCKNQSFDKQIGVRCYRHKLDILLKVNIHRLRPGTSCAVVG